MIECHLYKVLLEAKGKEETQEPIFWAYHMTESLARNAAIRWGEANYSDTVVTIKKIELIK